MQKEVEFQACYSRFGHPPWKCLYCTAPTNGSRFVRHSILKGHNSLAMKRFRIALANLQHPATPDESVSLAEQAIAQSSNEHADLICFPECFVPGYRGMGKVVQAADPAFLERAWARIAAAAAKTFTELRNAQSVTSFGECNSSELAISRTAMNISLLLSKPIEPSSLTT